MVQRKKPTKKVSKQSKLQEAKISAKNIEKAVEANLNAVKGMDKKTYLKYYISVLDDQIKEAKKVLKQKKRELRKVK